MHSIYSVYGRERSPQIQDAGNAYLHPMAHLSFHTWFLYRRSFRCCDHHRQHSNHHKDEKRKSRTGELRVSHRKVRSERQGCSLFAAFHRNYIGRGVDICCAKLSEQMHLRITICSCRLVISSCFSEGQITFLIACFEKNLQDANKTYIGHGHTARSA